MNNITLNPREALVKPLKPYRKKKKKRYLIPGLTNNIKSLKIFYNKEYKMAVIS